VVNFAHLPSFGSILTTAVPAQPGPPASSANSSCPRFISNYTSGVADLNIFTSFLRTYESVGLDTHPSSGFSLFAPTDRAWNRIEQTLSAHAMFCMLSCEHALMRRLHLWMCVWNRNRWQQLQHSDQWS
jgi:hypothetical protein